MTWVQQVRLTVACFSRGEGEVAVGGVSPALLQLMVGCAQGGVSVVCRRFGEQKSRLRYGNGAGEDE